jgi:PilZ domain
MPESLRSSEPAVVIVLQQEVPVRVVNISRSGCLLLTSRPVRAGTVGRLRIALDDVEYGDDVRVARCVPLPASACEVGVELLWVPQELRSGVPSLTLRLRVSGEGLMSAPPRPADS